MLFIQTKCGLIKPIIAFIKTFPNLHQGIEYISFIRKDITRIKTNFLKIPSYYKSSKTAFFLTNSELNVEGLSKNACALFGLPAEYIKRNKKITSQPFSILELNSSLGEKEFQYDLEIGKEILIDPSSFLKYFDFLKKEEERKLKQTSGLPRNVFVMMKNLNYYDLANSKSFVMIDTRDNANALGRLMKKKKYLYLIMKKTYAH